jgi:hypothetical protein
MANMQLPSGTMQNKNSFLPAIEWGFDHSFMAPLKIPFYLVPKLRQSYRTQKQLPNSITDR